MRTRILFIPILLLIFGFQSGSTDRLREDRSNSWKDDRLGEDRSNSWKDERLDEDRSNLTLRITALCPQSWNYSLFLGGSGGWLSSDLSHLPLLPMIQVSEDRWEFDISYNNGLAGYNCNNCYADDFILTGDSLHMRIYALQGKALIPMVGTMTKVTFPISASSSYFDDLPEVVIAPNFDNLQGDVHSFEAVHSLFGERKIGVYLPPGYHNPYKKFPVTIATDFPPSELERILPQLNSWFTTSNVETVILGFGDWKEANRNADRANLLTPYMGDGFKCKNGSFDDFCGGCLDPNNMSLPDYLRCCDVIKEGGGANELLDWLLGDIMTHLVESWPGRLLTDRDNLGVVGSSLGGLFSCYAAWTRDRVFGRAACQSPSFWWPTSTATLENEFNFINKTLKDPKLRINRFPQRILIDVGDEGGDSFWMIGASQFVANEMEKLPFFYKDKNVWVHVYPGKDHSQQSFVARLWNALKIMWN